MAFVPQQQEEETNRLPSLKDAAPVTPRTTSTTGMTPDFAAVVQQQQEITQARLADQQEDAQFLMNFLQAESTAQQAAGQRRAELTSLANESLGRLQAAQAMNPIVRDLRAIVGAFTGDDSANIRKLSQQAQIADQQLRTFERGESARQQASQRGLQLFQQLDEVQEQGFDVRQEALDNQLSIASTFSTLASQQLNRQVNEVQFSLKQRELSRTQRQDTLSQLGLSQVLDLTEQAQASDTGFVDINGVQLSLGDLEAETNKRRGTLLDLEAAELANASARTDIADRNYKSALQSLTLEQLQATAQNNFTVVTQTDQGPKEYALPPALVRDEIARRLEMRQESAGITTDLDIESASAIAELDILQRRTGDVVLRVESFFGANSGASRDIADELTRGSAGLAGLIGPVQSQAALQEQIETGTIPKERAASISRQAKKINSAVETQVNEMVKTAFPDDPVGQESLAGFLTGVDQTPAAAMTTLIKLALAGTPRGITMDSPTGQAISAVRESTMSFLQRNLQDPPNMAEMSGDELIKLSINRNTNRVRSEHEGLIGIAAQAAYNRWSQVTTDQFLSQSVNAPESPAFGRLTPSLINAALANAQEIAMQKVPDDQAVNERAAIEAAEFMKQLKSIPVDGKNAAEVYVEHLNSDAFANFVSQSSEQLRSSSFPAYLLDNGTIQGNFLSDLFSLRDLYTRQAGAIQQEAMRERAELTSLFEDENQRNLFAIRVAGYLASGADPDAVNQYVDDLASTYDGDAQQIFDSINRNREAHSQRERIRKGILTEWGNAGLIFRSILQGLAQTKGTVQARGTGEARQGIGRAQEIERAAELQRELGVFPMNPITEVTN